ncbi:Pam17-domain-containing protein [Bimuria novae-zelandiae CBS 107.79]|uniref:Presequence translocated-associated motor subunit PAM17 n=1 Tax=Bimuria novae-zelandiae CBS 107.79 TaxID=1447943 RepID=A0A6A5UH28_9PLEO|nr:Pam17-domain-containing protein [Bimuria novae-zelandiae CBS 107.79]
MFASTALRSARTITIRLQPGFIAPCASATVAPFSTKTSMHPAKVQSLKRPSLRPSPLALAIRHASTAASANTNAAPLSSQQLTWNDFFALRKTRRRASQVTSGFTAIGVAYAGLQVFIGQGYDGALAATIGLDPIITTGLASAAMLTVGWLVGPFFSNVVFNLRNRAIAPQITKKEREFYDRIKKHRVDPTSSSMANPVPDYYGEKIGSVADYRRWLKDQRAFNLKRGEKNARTIRN